MQTIIRFFSKADESYLVRTWRRLVNKMGNKRKKTPEWVIKGKTIKQLIKELKTFEEKDIEVRISLDSGETSKPISLVGKSDGHCLLMNCELDSE